MYRKKLKAVSFAEIIIAVVILAVVAGFTIPTVIQDLQMVHHRSLWKNFFKDFSTVHTKVIVDNRGTALNLFTDANALVDLYGAHLNSITTCKGSTGCWHAADGWKDLDGTLRSDTYNTGFFLTSKILVAVQSVSTDCSDNTYGIPICAGMLVDINAFEGPNIQGKDIFYFYIQKSNIRAAGAMDTYGINSCNTSSSGHSCAAEYLRQ